MVVQKEQYMQITSKYAAVLGGIWLLVTDAECVTFMLMK